MSMWMNKVNYFISDESGKLELYRVTRNEVFVKSIFKPNFTEAPSRFYTVEKIVFKDHTSLKDIVNKLAVKKSRTKKIYSTSVSANRFWINDKEMMDLIDNIPSNNYTSVKITKNNNKFNEPIVENGNFVIPDNLDNEIINFIKEKLSLETKNSITFIEDNMDVLSTDDKKAFAETMTIMYKNVDNFKQIVEPFNETVAAFNDMIFNSEKIIAEIDARLNESLINKYNKLNNDVANSFIKDTLYMKDKYNV